jgi:hypothetical protein
MALNRDERSAVLAILLRKDHEAFSKFVETNTNLTKDQKIELLSLDLQLIYGEDLDAIHRMIKVIGVGSAPE